MPEHYRVLFSADLDIISEEPLRISMIANKPGHHDIPGILYSLKAMLLPLFVMV